jgi:hypothetical protein
MNCSESQDLLQRRLDGEPIDERAALNEHLHSCAECRQLHAVAGRLEDGLRLFAPPMPRRDLSATIVGAVLADRRERTRTTRRRWLSVAAVAAGLLLAVYAGQRAGFFSGRSTEPVVANPGPTPPTGVAIKQPEEPLAGPSVVASVFEVSSAVASLTKRTATETVGQTWLLLPDSLPTPSLTETDVVPPLLEPAAGSLLQAGQSVSAALDPVTSSAKRAFSLFVREGSSQPEKE